ncbi:MULTISPECIES: L-rhamnose mutarotase [Caballeronia]|jgi:L-rhamnose mutarotase|uniref:L-rhamnose mutarotase n=1 Tax=Caballeronia zhejiangensis TaxID=871203 RepID=A0A656QJB4_9BURK|nr:MULTISPECIES: L-rhamnose mutarotase [Caballeronia]EKS66758.1 L-rhamnose 1-epimerase [Burkholderia sp. SJ98]KDR31015.1 L-rhamnose mutarotase [Caballeronia zhejiangensis]MDR5789964.1 L-rhamnose mutarotase [Caballeronia sp. LP003]
METVAFRMTLKPGMRDEYEKRHREIWPELADALRAAGIRDYRIFLDDSNGHLFGIYQRTDTHTTDALPTLPIMRKWWNLMAELMDTHADNSPVTTPLVPVFHLP